MLFPQDVKNLTHIHADHCASDLSLSEFKQFCHGVWSCGSAGHNFVAIDLTNTPMNGKNRQNFNRLYFPVNLNRGYMYVINTICLSCIYAGDLALGFDQQHVAVG